VQALLADGDASLESAGNVIEVVSRLLGGLLQRVWKNMVEPVRGLKDPPKSRESLGVSPGIEGMDPSKTSTAHAPLPPLAAADQTIDTIGLVMGCVSSSSSSSSSNYPVASLVPGLW